MTRSNNIPIIDAPGGTERTLGCLHVSCGAKKYSLPLGSVDISAKVIDSVTEVTVKQVFRNTLRDHMEAVYIFPLAAGCAVSKFDMKVGSRVIKGIVEERGEARRQYQQAVVEGKRAALMEQERDDVFTVQVGNLPPGEEVTIEISYSERLPYFENGNSELRLPLVVAPRYIPGRELNRDQVGDGVDFDTDLVPDASRISPPRLASGVDPATALKVKVEILSQDGTLITDLSCSQHASKASLSDGGVTVSLSRVDERLNRDFVLRWRSGSDNVKTSLLTYTDGSGETFGLLSIMPPRRNGYLGAARDIVFVLDRSGSMGGVKMTSAARSCAILLNTLGPNDRYAIAAFDNVVEWMPACNGSYFTDADTVGIEKGEKYLRGIDARGGTEMDNAISHAFQALNSRNDRAGRLPSLVVLTDGEVGNESQILQRVQNQIGDARLFVVGIDTAVNSGLLKRLANLGGGTATFVEPGNQLEEALASIGREIGAPLVTDIRVEDLDLSIDQTTLSPSRVPDIFAGRSSVCFFKLHGNKGRISVKGKLPDGKTLEVKVKAQRVNMPCIAQLWAKSHIVELEDIFRVNPNARHNLKNQIVSLAVKHSLLTKFTAFVVVDEAEIVNRTGHLIQMVQPVESPAQWQQTQTGSMKMACKVMMEDTSDLLATSTRLRSLSRIMPVGQLANDEIEAQSHSGWALSPSSDAVSGGGGWGAPAPASAEDAWGAAQFSDSQCSDAYGEAEQAQAPGQWMNFVSPNSPQPQQAPARAEAPLSAPQPPAPRPSAPRPSAPIPAPSPKMQRSYQQQPPANPPAGAISGALHAFKEMFMPAQDKRQTDKRSAENARIKPVLDDFFSEFESSFEKIKQNNLPDAGKLEAVRLKLVQQLAPTNLAMDLPLLQKFLRASAIELVNSLKDPNVTLEDLIAFWNSKEAQFKVLKGELDSLINLKEAAFWECSV